MRGPWRTLEAAQAQAESYARWPLLSSQYAPRGCYQIILVEAEALPDGRMILANRLIAPGFIGENETFDEVLLRGKEFQSNSGKPINVSRAA